MPDAFGLGLAWNAAKEVPDQPGEQKGNAWFRAASGGPYQDGAPSEHDFQGGLFGGDRCKYPGCNGQPRAAHDGAKRGPQPENFPGE